MKTKVITAALLISSLLGYLEWGKGKHILLFQAEAEVFGKLLTHPAEVFHPFILLPVFGQMLLLVALLIRKPPKWLFYTGTLSIGLLLYFMLFIGVLNLNFKIMAGALPFTMLSVYVFLSMNKNRVNGL